MDDYINNFLRKMSEDTETEKQRLPGSIEIPGFGEYYILNDIQKDNGKYFRGYVYLVHENDYPILENYGGIEEAKMSNDKNILLAFASFNMYYENNSSPKIFGNFIPNMSLVLFDMPLPSTNTGRTLFKNVISILKEPSNALSATLSESMRSVTNFVMNLPENQYKAGINFSLRLNINNPDQDYSEIIYSIFDGYMVHLVDDKEVDRLSVGYHYYIEKFKDE